MTQHHSTADVAGQYEALTTIGLNPDDIAAEIGITVRSLWQALRRAHQKGETNVYPTFPDSHTSRAPRAPLPSKAALRRWYRDGCPLK